MKDAVAILIDDVLCQLKEAKTDAGVLYLDMSSAFNTLQPYLLLKKFVFQIKLESELALRVLDLLDCPTSSIDDRWNHIPEATYDSAMCNFSLR